MSSLILYVEWNRSHTLNAAVFFLVRLHSVTYLWNLHGLHIYLGYDLK